MIVEPPLVRSAAMFCFASSSRASDASSGDMFVNRTVLSSWRSQTPKIAMLTTAATTIAPSSTF